MPSTGEHHAFKLRAHAAVGALVVMAGWAGACGSGPAGVASTFTPDGGLDGTTVPDTGKLGSNDAGHLGSSEAGGYSPTSLILTPAAATVTVTGVGAVTASFTLQGKLAGGGYVDITPESVQFDRPDLAKVTSNEPIVATAPSSAVFYGGTGTIHAVYKGLEATAKLTVKVAMADYGAGLSATSPAVIALNAVGTGSSTQDGGSKDGSAGGSDGAAQDSGSSSGGANDPAPNIRPLLYPYDKTIWPLGLTSPRIMWNAPHTGDVYRVHYAEQAFSYDGYFTLAATPAQAPLVQAIWDELTASNNAAKTADPLSFSLSRYDSGSKKAYLSDTQTWTVAPESLAGAIYYWTVSLDNGNQFGHVSRFHPGTGAVPQQLDNGECVGCHAVNAQGTVLVGDIDDTGWDGGGTPAATAKPYWNGWSGTRPWARFDITQPSSPITYQSNKYGADLALTPDGKYLIFGGQTPAGDGGVIPAGSKFLSLGDPTTGNVIATSGLDQVTGFDPTKTNMMMPAFSPDGTKLAVIVSPAQNDGFQDNVLPQVLNGSPTDPPEALAFLNFDESGPTFQPALNPITDTNNAAFANLGGTGMAWNGMAYPSFTPASDAIAFHVGQYATGCNSYNAGNSNGDISCGDLGSDNGTLFIATVAAKNPIRMANADTPPVAADANSAVEPTFNPIQRGGYSWVVFTSLRAFGNQPWPAEVPNNAGLINAKRRLWVAAIDPTIGTVDPSHPAIYLEGQADTPNMRAFWTLASCIATPGASASGLDGGTSSTDAGKSGGGAGDGGAQCTNGFQCCSGFCENGQCVDVSTVACAGVAAACKSTGDCCNPSVITCLDSICQPSMAK